MVGGPGIACTGYTGQRLMHRMLQNYVNSIQEEKIRCGVYNLYTLCQDLHYKGPNSQEDPTTQVHRDETSSIQDLPNHDTPNQVPENQHPTNQAPLNRTPARQDPSRQDQPDQVPASQVTPDHDPSNQEPRNHDRPICKFYWKGTCRHGISGKGCPNRYPPACKALIQHGNRGPRDCTNGNKCKEFHPKMCQQSL